MTFETWSLICHKNCNCWNSAGDGVGTGNCTTDLLEHFNPAPLDYRILFNNHIDAAAYEWGALDRSMPFGELHRLSLIDARAQAVPDMEDFWQYIRVGLPRMTPADWPRGK